MEEISQQQLTTLDYTVIMGKQFFCNLKDFSK